jgi:hypothetical protein
VQVDEALYKLESYVAPWQIWSTQCAQCLQFDVFHELWHQYSQCFRNQINRILKQLKCFLQRIEIALTFNNEYVSWRSLFSSWSIILGRLFRKATKWSAWPPTEYHEWMTPFIADAFSLKRDCSVRSQWMALKTNLSKSDLNGSMMCCFQMQNPNTKKLIRYQCDQLKPMPITQFLYFQHLVWWSTVERSTHKCRILNFLCLNVFWIKVPTFFFKARITFLHTGYCIKGNVNLRVEYLQIFHSLSMGLPQGVIHCQELFFTTAIQLHQKRYNMLL